MDNRERNLRYKRMWSEYTDRVITTAQSTLDDDAAIEVLIEEAKNANEHAKQVAAAVLRMCPDLTAATLVQIINNKIPVVKREFGK